MAEGLKRAFAAAKATDFSPGDRIGFTSPDTFSGAFGRAVKSGRLATVERIGEMGRILVRVDTTRRVKYPSDYSGWVYARDIKHANTDD